MPRNYLQFIVELHRLSAGDVSGDKFTVHGLTASDRATILTAYQQGELGSKAKVADKGNVKGVLVAQDTDYMAMLNVLTTQCGYMLQSESRMPGLQVGSEFRCLSYYMLYREITQVTQGTMM